jgi:hypothetical protein
MRIVILSFILFISINCFADIDSLTVNASIDSMSIEINRINETIATLRNQIQTNSETVDLYTSEIIILDSTILKLNQIIKQNKKENIDDFGQIDYQMNIFKNDIQTQDDSLKYFISAMNHQVNTLEQLINERIDSAELKTQKVSTTLNNLIKDNVLKFLIICAILFSISIFIYVISRKSLKQNNLDILDKINATRKSLEEEAINLDNKLIELLNKQINLVSDKMHQTEISNTEIDHSLALKVADEIIRIEKNLNRMDKSIKGHKQLQGSVKRIKDNFVSKEYQIVDMVGKKYDTGMKVTANFVPDESLDKDEQIITRIIKPQVNYKDKMIQSAQIEVSIGG